MSADTAREYLESWGHGPGIIELAGSIATVELAARALDTDPARIAKTLSFSDRDGCLLVIAAGDAKIDNAAFRAAFGRKARMLSPDEVLAHTGHPVGGVCPFGVPKEVAVYADVSLRRFETVYPACGSANTAIEMTPQEMYRVSGARRWVDVCKNWREAER